MRVFGLTGGIASGKSTVGALYRELGVPVVDADQVAREVVAPGTPALADIGARFGASVIRADGSLDRAALAAVVFADEAARKALEAITHPRIRERSAELLKREADAGAPLACYEAALLIESGQAELFRPLVVVATSPEVQAARAKARDGESAEAVARRLAAQMPLAEKIAKADVVISNDGTREELAGHARAALAQVCRLVDVDPARYGV